MEIKDIDRFLGPDLKTYDPYDLWKTGLGLKLKKLYYEKGKIAIPLVAPFYLLDAFAPRLVRLCMRPQEYPIVRALATLATLNFYEITLDRKYLDLAACSVDWLIANQSPGYGGACWGLNMRWMTKTGYSPAETPFVTHTPYCVEALLKFHDVTKDEKARDVALSSLEFLENHLRKLIDEPHRLALSYGPSFGSRIVINGNSYAMMMYALLAESLPGQREMLREKALRLFNFLKTSQNRDGSWLYYADNEEGNFIDCFHSCFVLKNMLKSGKRLGVDISDPVDRGLEYVLENFLDGKFFLARRFSLSTNPSLTKFDLYDQAELLNVLLLAGRTALAEKLYASIMKHFYIPAKGTFGSQIDLFGILHRMTYLRWAVMPMIYALSAYWKVAESGKR
ncbi:hypothetical protein EG832_01075 [bacterium]|nr:hypothetical protein [bacterium]